MKVRTVTWRFSNPCPYSNSLEDLLNAIIERVLGEFNFTFKMGGTVKAAQLKRPSNLSRQGQEVLIIVSPFDEFRTILKLSLAEFVEEIFGGEPVLLLINTQKLSQCNDGIHRRVNFDGA